MNGALSSLTGALAGPIMARGQPALIPRSRLAGPILWVVAIMVALTVLAVAAGLSLARLTAAASSDLAGAITVQVLEPNPDLARAGAERAAALLRATPGVSDVRVVPRAEIDALVQPWLDVPASDADAPIPLPALVEARLAGTTGEATAGDTGRALAERLGTLRRDMHAAVPAARIDAQSSWLTPVFSAVASLQWLAAALVALLGGATAAAVLLAVRTALGTHRETIEIVHLLGGTDSQIARIFERAIGADAALGGLAGLALGIIGVFAVGGRFAALGAGLVDGGQFAWYDWLALCAVPAAGVGLAVVTARLAVLRALGRMT
ncbi:cell division protein FtsX [Parablastomonas sp. CN1-191]|uniref:cell division protein FtsX n=1 Tax=Parablastomonas sp. CN1-191 TaxID=3400908 RepID=UPI003BF85507